MKNLVLVRGCPGSGKSTFAIEILMVEYVISADDYFTDNEGNYNFDITKIKDAHNYCRNKCQAYMEEGLDIAVHNTFTQVWEMEPYFKLAEEYGYRIFTIIVENRHGSENIHNVPDETLIKMKKRFEVSL